MRGFRSVLKYICAAMAIGFLCAFAGLQTVAQNKPKEKPVQASDAENKAYQKIKDTKDSTAKLQAATEFAQKYPKSPLREKVVEVVLVDIDAVRDPAAKVKLAEGFLGTFAEANEANRGYPILVDAYVAAKRIDDAFNAAKPWLELNPNEVDVLYILAIVGTNEARQQNAKFVSQSQQYGLKAIELIEANKRPEGISAEQWAKASSGWLPQLYQSMGLLALLTNNNAEALNKLSKAADLNKSDPFNYVMLGNIRNEQYAAEARQYQAMPEGAAKVDAQKKLLAQLDVIIDLFAHALGLMSGKPEYQKLSEQVLPDLTSYYKFRHSSTDGMEQLINKYKAPQSP